MSFKLDEVTNDLKLKFQKLSYLPYRITFFASSGNALHDYSAEQDISQANYYYVFGVGGIIFKDQDHIGARITIAKGAGYASCYYTRSTARNSTPLVVAPGESIEVMSDTDNDGDIDDSDYSIVSGTSLSSAILSAIGYMIFKIQNYRYPTSYTSLNEIYLAIEYNSEGLNEDITRQPAAGSTFQFEDAIGWGGVDFYDYCLWVYTYFTPPAPPPGGGGGGGGGHRPR